MNGERENELYCPGQLEKATLLQSYLSRELIEMGDYILSEVSQTEKDNSHVLSCLCGITNTSQMNLPMKQKQTHREQTYGYQRGKVGGGIHLEFGVSRYKLLHTKQINNKVLLYNTGNYIQCPVINHHGKEYEKECVSMYN